MALESVTGITPAASKAKIAGVPASKMHRVIFYSWESDLPNPTNRSLIQRALENAARAISADDQVDVEPVIDRDTQGVAGSPDIAKTIFQKIERADIVVADVSIVSKPGDGRPTPNPNVLVELGYALHALGDERVVLVFNTAFGKLEQLPFDLKMRRALAYSMTESATDRAMERRDLESKLDAAIRAALSSLRPTPTRSALVEATDAIENQRPNRVITVRRFLSELIQRIDEKRPKSISDGGGFHDIESAILDTAEIVLDYTKLADTVATVGDEKAASDLYREFGPLIERYDLSRGPHKTMCIADFDYFKFLGHELFATFIACLIRENQWEMIAELFSKGIPVRYWRRLDGPANVSFAEISRDVEFNSQQSQARALCRDSPPRLN